jgi:ceramide synthetase
MEIIYIIQFSHHAHGFLNHLLSKSFYGKAKYFEYLLHHFLAMILIFYSYVYDFWSIGIMVLLFHDFSDAVLQFGRFIVVNLNENIGYKFIKNKINFIYSILSIYNFRMDNV